MSRDFDPIIKSARDLFRAQEELAEFSVDVLSRIRTQLKGAILDVSGDDLAAPVTYTGQRRLLEQVDKYLAGAFKELGEARPMLQRLYEGAYQNTINELTTLAEKFPATGWSKGDIRKLKALEPRLTGLQIQASFQATLERITGVPAPIKEELRSLLAVGNLTGQSYGDISRSLVGAGLEKGVFKTVEERARVIAITETTNIHSFASYESIKESNERLSPEKQILIRWSSLLDQRTSGRCRNLHGQVRKQGEKFKSGPNAMDRKGWTGYKPAAHPRCRSTIVPYRKAWEKAFRDLDEAIRAKDSRFV
jgi:hypothetical protein